MCAYQGVERLVRRLARLQTIVDFVGPGAHLHSTDELWVDDSLLVEVRKDDLQLVADQMRLQAGCRVQCG